MATALLALAQPARCPLDHDSLKLSPLWDHLRYVGIQPDEPHPLELRTCTCGSTLARPVPALVRITALGDCLYLVESTTGLALYREVDGRRGSTLERATADEQNRYEAYDALDPELFLTACEIVCDGRSVPGCEVAR